MVGPVSQLLRAKMIPSANVNIFHSQIFPSFAPVQHAAIQNSVLANIRAKRAATKVAQMVAGQGTNAN